ncbi:amino acid/amide ABC transporter substrate-binding protein, HAAT family (TC 3.A.1.4.-) [Collimonas sp. OK607]|uniref:branched-chain amino acid ABC transporter substrate-binding protein n=1 Tax=Collimonas sp. OK607 TaxID=1798194 RepID=UPI0008EBE6FF|nr:branched-chain amino acid ABC transporter substrate-binding protein [Collimonas sp. OK607]SFA86057.1 amino acid/amide ABC transporter substrate-binding protein, HAAT family (TC 3.A.1.4.-) [Collimonas sp. OK607]
MQNHAKATFLTAAIALTLSATLASPVQAQEQVVKIAHVGPITGPVAHVGKDNENGARMAIDDLNAKHLVIGGKKIQFVLQAEDDGSDPKQATSVAQKLVDAKVAAVIGHLQSGTSIPASKIYFDAGIPQISPSATSAKYTEQGFNTTFRVVANDSQLGAAMGRYAAKTLHAKRIAVIDDRTAYGQGLANEFLKDAKANGVEIVSTQYTNDRATDFNAILTAVKAKQPDLIFFGGIDASAGTMLRQMRQLGITANFMGGDAICTGALPRLAGEGLIDDKVYCAIAGGVENPAPLEAFKAAYKKKYNADIVQYAPYTYDAVMVIAKAMQQANSVDPKKYLQALSKIQYTGVTGKIAFDDKGDIKNGTLSIYTFRNGQQTLLTLTK